MRRHFRDADGKQKSNSSILWCKLLTARSWFLHFKHKRCRPERLVSTRNEIFNLSAAVHVSKTFVHEPPIFLDPEDVLIISNFSALSDFFLLLVHDCNVHCLQ